MARGMPGPASAPSTLCRAAQTRRELAPHADDLVDRHQRARADHGRGEKPACRELAIYDEPCARGERRHLQGCSGKT